MSTSSNFERDDKAVTQSLRLAGVEVDSVYDLLKLRAIPERAVRALVTVYPLVNSPRVKEGIIRALSDSSSRELAGDFLVHEYQSLGPESPENSSLKWAIGNALGIQATKAHAHTLLAILTDRAHGRSRQMIAGSVWKTRASEAPRILRDLLEDDDVCAHAVYSLARLKDVDALPQIRSLLAHRMPVVRKEAAKAVRVLERELKRSAET